MKFRSDFVTNSSSSSFILAMGEGFTEKQKEIILNYAESKFFGKIVTLPKKDLTEEEWDDWCEENEVYISFEEMKNLKQTVKEGEKIHIGDVSFDEPEWHLGAIYENLWEKLNGVDGFRIIDGDLSY